MAVKAKKAKAAGAKAQAPRGEIAPLGWMRAKVLKKLELLGNDAFGYRVLQVLMDESDQWIDPSQVYGCIRALSAEHLIEFSHDRPASDRGPKMKVYRLTPAGHDALEATAEHHRRLWEYLSEPKKK